MTNSQYVEFLNVKDPTGTSPLQLYNSGMSTAYGGITYNSGAASGRKYSVMSGDGSHPVNYVTWFDTLRFANWLNNGQGNGDTESGAYILQGGTPTPSNANTITRETSATIFLPSEDEWYKAAYYDPRTTAQGGPPSDNHYWLYGTSSSSTPNASDPTATPNSANYNNVVGNLTDVGAYSGTTSPHGAFDMGGEAWQWNEALINGSFRGLRGGPFDFGSDRLASSFRSFSIPTTEYDFIGFRVATVPEPSTAVLAILGLAAVLLFRTRRRGAAACVVASTMLGLCFGLSNSASAVTINWVPIGNSGNAADPSTGYGAVAYNYSIDTYDVTVGQYTEFLNAVAATDPYRLYSTSMGTDQNIEGIDRSGSPGSYSYSAIGTSANLPITYVSWGDAARFANWLANGQPTGAGRTDDNREWLVLFERRDGSSSIECRHTGTKCHDCHSQRGRVVQGSLLRPGQ